MLSFEVLFLQGLVLTVSTECLCAWPLQRWVAPQVPRAKWLFVIGSVSVLTLPYFWFVLPAAGLPWIWYVVMGESGIVLIEALLIAVLLDVHIGYALLASLLINLASIGTGYVWTTFVV